jgi:hypothetical protein
VIVVGLDPGLHGAIALHSAENGSELMTWDVPTLTVSKSKKSGKGLEVDWYRYILILETIAKTQPILAVVELVGPMRSPGGQAQGVGSAFTFGKVSGGQDQLLQYILKCRTVHPTPATWKRAMKVGTQNDDIYRRACELFPNARANFVGPRGGIRDGVCEAAMLAKYGEYILANGE